MDKRGGAALTLDWRVPHGNFTMDEQAVVVADVTGRIRLWNAGAEQLFGLGAAQVLGQPLDLIIPDEYRAAHHPCFAQAMQTGTAKMENQPFDLPVTARGEVVVVRGVLTLVRDPNKLVIGAMAVLTLPEVATV
jgi:PAS domain S-box-containing protein